MNLDYYHIILSESSSSSKPFNPFTHSDNNHNRIKRASCIQTHIEFQEHFAFNLIHTRNYFRYSQAFCVISHNFVTASSDLRI